MDFVFIQLFLIYTNYRVFDIVCFFFFRLCSLNIVFFLFDDRNKYLCVGGDEGMVRLFEIKGDLTEEFDESETYMNRVNTQEAYIKDWGARVYPAAVDLNNDSISDLLIGNNRGGVHYMEGKDTASVSVGKIIKQSFYMAPNPTNGSVRIFTKSKEKLTGLISS